MNDPPGRTYTVSQANAALAEVDPLVARIATLYRDLPELQEAVQIANYRTSRDHAGPELERSYEVAKRAQYDAEMELARAVARLESMNITLKDPAIGLIDFYGYRDDELVELCWKLGEREVGFWHRIGDGFAGRRPV